MKNWTALLFAGWVFGLFPLASAVGAPVEYGHLDGVSRSVGGPLNPAEVHVDAIYCTQLAGLHRYRLQLPKGTYTIRLHFVQLEENDQPANNGQVTVRAQGRDVVTDLPVYRFVGPRRVIKGTVKPVVREFEATLVEPGLDLDFSSGRDGLLGAAKITAAGPRAMHAICAIEVAGHAGAPSLAIDCGSARSLKAADGREWLPDRLWPSPQNVEIPLVAESATNRWVNISDEILTQLAAHEIFPICPSSPSVEAPDMGVVCVFSDRAGNTFASILGQGIWAYGGPGGKLRRVDGGLHTSVINARSKSNNNVVFSGGKQVEGYIQLLLNPNGAGFVPISWMCRDTLRSQVVWNGNSFSNFWEPSSESWWDIGAVDWSDSPPRRFLTALHEKDETWLSTDGGKTFAVVTTAGPRLQALGIIGPNILIKALSRTGGGGTLKGSSDQAQPAGIYRSADLGKTWTRVSDIEVTDWRGGMVYFKGRAWLNTPQGLAISDDQGATWRRLPGSPFFTQPICIGKEETHLMGVNREGFHESVDNGATWKRVVPTPQETGASVFFWDPVKDVFYGGVYNGRWFRFARTSLGVTKP